MAKKDDKGPIYNKRFELRISQEELDTVNEMRARFGELTGRKLSTSEYIRMLINDSAEPLIQTMGQAVNMKSVIDSEACKETATLVSVAVNQLRRIGVNLNQMVKLKHQGEPIDGLDELTAETAKVGELLEQVTAQLGGAGFGDGSMSEALGRAYRASRDAEILG